MLQLDPEKLIPRADSDAYRITVRDAYLLAGHQLPLEVDGRTLMALRHQGKLDPAPRSPLRDGEDRELAELAHRTGEPVAILRRLPASYHHQWLAAQRQADAARASAEMTAFRQQIADTFQPLPPMRLRSAFSAWRAAASRCPLERRDRRITGLLRRLKLSCGGLQAPLHRPRKRSTRGP